MEKMIAEGSLTVTENPKLEDIKKLGSSSYVKEYDYSLSAYIVTKNIKAYQAPTNESTNTTVDMPNHLNLKGSNLTEPFDFKEKKMKLVGGRTFTKEEIDGGKAVAIISKKVADANGLNVGDQLVLDNITSKYNSDGSSEEVLQTDLPMEIIGVFEPETVQKKNDSENKNFNKQIMETEQFNAVYMPNGAISAINKEVYEKAKTVVPDQYKNSDGSEVTEDQLNSATPTYILKSPEDVDAFKEEAKPYVPNMYKITSSTDEYDQVGGTFKKMSQISGYVVVLAIGAALLIISLVVILFLRDRKHELGIYLSLGETRAKVMQQIILELLLISLLAMCLSLVTGNFLGKVVSDSLITSDALATQTNTGSNDMNFNLDSMSMSNLTAEDVSQAYEVTFSLSYIITFLITGLGTVLLSAVLPLTYILKLNPKKIMM